MEPDELRRRIETAIPDATVTVSHPRGADDEDHLAVDVISPAFAGESVLTRHEMVREAVAAELTDSIHALEISTRTPETE